MVQADDLLLLRSQDFGRRPAFGVRLQRPCGQLLLLRVGETEHFQHGLPAVFRDGPQPVQPLLLLGCQEPAEADAVLLAELADLLLERFGRERAFAPLADQFAQGVVLRRRSTASESRCVSVSSR